MIKNMKTEGANILSNDEIISNSNAIVQMNIPSDENLKKLKKRPNFNWCFKSLFK